MGPIVVALLIVALGGAWFGLSFARKRASSIVPVASVKPVCHPGRANTVPKKTYQQAPDAQLDPSTAHTLVFETSCGRIEIALDVARAPKTASSVAFLAKDGFYDGLAFHRVVPGFVIQGGDPLGNGTGGPGYTITEAPPSDLKYTVGVVAMAKRGDEPAGASGSQFFIVSGPQAMQLPAEYALVGKVTQGMDVVALIERSGQANTAVIEKATVS